jgi:hypothetical protein
MHTMVYLTRFGLNGGEHQLIAKGAPPAVCDNTGSLLGVSIPWKDINPSIGGRGLQRSQIHGVTSHHDHVLDRRRNDILIDTGKHFKKAAHFHSKLAHVIPNRRYVN